MDDVLRCRHCGEVIGVYEPLIVSTGGRARETSRAAEDHDEARLRGDCYHRGCFEPREPDQASLQS